MWVAHTIADLRHRRTACTGPVGFVPTMGALHRGHVALIEQARQRCPQVIVSIFVNPTQFGPNEDFNRYPRPLEDDLAACRAAGAAGVFNPAPEQMYPPARPACEVNVPSLTNDLEGALRPGHFAGVCRVVAKLFHLVAPDFACFGRKDLQQLRVIQAMVADLDLPVEIVECETVREEDGLARSSRNRYLTAAERPRAVALFKALTEARLLIEQQGEIEPAAVESAMSVILRAHQLTVDYAVVRHPRTLARLEVIEPALTGGVAALIAARLGSVRLIDNMLIGVDA